LFLVEGKSIRLVRAVDVVMAKGTVVILSGVSCAGKTSVGERVPGKVDAIFLDGDDFHSESNVAKMRAGIPLTDEGERVSKLLGTVRIFPLVYIGG